MAAQPPTGPADIATWPELVREGLERMGMTQAELARQLARTDADKTVVNRWLKGAVKRPPADVVAATARILEIPPVKAMRVTGHMEIAELLSPDALGSPSSSEPAAGELAVALEPLIAVVREMTDDLDPEQRARLIQRFVERNQDSLLLLEHEVSQARQRVSDKGAKDKGTETGANGETRSAV